MVQRLIDEGADVDEEQEDSGDTPLCNAASRGRAVQVEPMEPTLKDPGSKRSK